MSHQPFKLIQPAPKPQPLFIDRDSIWYGLLVASMIGGLALGLVW